jgi:hypothetical protein
MPGLVPGIHVLRSISRKTWMAGISPAMTEEAMTEEMVPDFRPAQPIRIPERVSPSGINLPRRSRYAHFSF